MEKNKVLSPLKNNNGIRIVLGTVTIVIIAFGLIYTIADHTVQSIRDQFNKHELLAGHPGMQGKVEKIDVQFAEVETQFDNQGVHIELQRSEIKDHNDKLEILAQELARLQVEIEHLKNGKQ